MLNNSLYWTSRFSEIVDEKVESLRTRVITSLQSGFPVNLGVIGTSEEQGNAAVGYINNLVFRSRGLLRITMLFNRGDGGSLYVDNGGDLGIADGQLDAILSELAGVKGAKACIVGFGVNDLTASASAASTTQLDYYIGKWKLIANTLLAADILPIFTGPMPVNSKNKFETISADRHLARFCEIMGYPYVHLHALTCNPVDGNVLTTYSADGTHPNSIGADRIGKEVWNVISGGTPNVSPWTCSSRADYVNTGTFPGVQLGADNANVINTGTSAADGTNWGTGTGVVAATGSGYVKGHWIQVTNAASTDRSTNFYPLTTTAITNKSIVAGNVMRYAVRYRSDVAGHDSTISMRFLPSGGTTVDPLGRDCYIADDNVEGILVVDKVFESGQTNMRFFGWNEYNNFGAGTYGETYFNGACGILLSEIDTRLGL